MKNIYILGINAFHADASACLFSDGVMVAAVEEERFRRIKHWSGFPSMSIEYCLAAAGISLADVDHIAINQNSRSTFFRKISFILFNRPSLSLIFKKFKIKRKRFNIISSLNIAFPNSKFKGKFHYVEHHLAHLASAFFVSPFNNAVALSIDGFGDFASSAWGEGLGTRIRVDGRVYFPHSLGIFYQALTQYIGFPNYGDEYKVMGLAPYGKPIFLSEMRKIVLLQPNGSFRLNLRYFCHHMQKTEDDLSNKELKNHTKFTNLFSQELEKLLGPSRASNDDLTQRHMDIASSIQAMYEEAFFHLLNSLYKHYQLPSVVIAGGCGMNSVANGKIKLRTPFTNVYIQSAAGDAGGAVGSALSVWHQLGNSLAKLRGPIHDHAYWGPEYSDLDIQRVIDASAIRIADKNCSVTRSFDLSDLYATVAKKIADGSVIGWYQGRMEWGPRALGNRSILGDPRRADMKDILNIKIKRRESFRPFAPSILRERVLDWFEQDGEVPFMMEVYQIKEEKRSLIPAVTHVDGSGRLQTVSQVTNPRYHGLITEFFKQTGVPMLLNTSFNENEPVVCTPTEALDCFLRTNMDVLVMGDWVITRNV